MDRKIARVALDIFDLTPGEDLTQNEIDAAKSVKFARVQIPQDQPKVVWPATFSLPRAYLDQLARDNGLSSDAIAQTRKDLDAAEKRKAFRGRRGRAHSPRPRRRWSR